MQLAEDGWTVIERVLTRHEAADLAEKCEAVLADPLARRMNDKAASGTTRASELLGRVPDLRSALDRPPVRAAVEQVLGPGAQLFDAALRLVRPGFGEQEFHADGPGPSVTCIVALCDFTTTNGPTAVLPGSHCWRPRQRERTKGRRGVPGEQRLVGPAGSVFVFTSQLLHRGTRNDADRPRPALQVFWRPG
jgi:hypothetical protein